MAYNSTHSQAKVTTREVDLSAEVKKMWGKKWNEPEEEYVFSNGRKFIRRTEEAGIYQDE